MFTVSYASGGITAKMKVTACMRCVMRSVFLTAVSTDIMFVYDEKCFILVDRQETPADNS